MSKLTDEELLEELRKRIKNNKESLLELKELNKELQIVNKKLEESESLKSHFISNITNEIINPFTSIIGLARQAIMPGTIIRHRCALRKKTSFIS